MPVVKISILPQTAEKKGEISKGLTEVLFQKADLTNKNT